VAGLAKGDPYWPAQLSVLAALLLHVVLPERLTLGPRWLVPALEAILLVGLFATNPAHPRDETPRRRAADIALIALISAANALALALLVDHLLAGGTANGRQVILSAIDIWLTNVVVFGLWYWQMDRGGPGNRARDHASAPDFLFAQMTVPTPGRGWRAGFVDYLYLSFTNSTAFSPTDTMPLTARAKLLMLVQALASLITIALVAGRAVNILT
jgi:hypothetical protein